MMPRLHRRIRRPAAPPAPYDELPRDRLPKRARTIALIVASAMLMEQLDSTVLTTALPTMARSFHTDPLHMSVALTSYLVSLAVLIPASGRISDRLGSRTVFMAAIALFTLASLLCAEARSLGILVMGRLLQGAGGAMMVPVGRLVLLRSVEKRHLVSAMFWLLMPVSIGPLLGGPLGGFLTTYLSWRWIFTINIPIGVLGLVLAARFIPQLRETVRQPLDGVGVLLSGTSLACLVFGLELAARGVGSLSATIATLGVSLTAGLLYVRHARRVRAPILDFTLLRIPTFRMSVASGSATRIAIGATPFLIPSMLQLGFGLSAAQSGLVTLTGALGSIAMRLIVKRVLRRFGYRLTMAVNGASTCALTFACALFHPGWPFWLLSLALLLGGFSQTLQFMALNTIAYADVPDQRMSAATSLYTTLQQLTLTIGISVAAGVLSATRALITHQDDALLNFSVAFVVIGVVSTVAIPAALRLSPDAGAEISGHRKR
ncbi:MFS transporter [Lichenicola sp.]|uniref:MFS transporter n=1 Tax=Lichenicola sp. TaxID=2804529 RepID=UPI003AFFBF48